MSRKRKPLSVDEAGLDTKTRARRVVLSEMQKMSPAELFALAVRAGIYTKQGRLAEPYRDEAGPSASRPTD